MLHFEKDFVKQATEFLRDYKSLEKEADESLEKVKFLGKENDRLLEAVMFSDIMFTILHTFDNIYENNSSEFINPNHEFENILEKHSISLELQLQNQSLTSRICERFLKNSSDVAIVKKDIDEIETINIELEHRKNVNTNFAKASISGKPPSPKPVVSSSIPKSRLSKFVMFMGTVRFKIDNVAAIQGYGDLQCGNILNC
ncbi:hypothetical protein Tco_0433291 [Tanacetum coccineum]